MLLKSYSSKMYLLSSAYHSLFSCLQFCLLVLNPRFRFLACFLDSLTPESPRLSYSKFLIPTRCPLSELPKCPISNPFSRQCTECVSLPFFGAFYFLHSVIFFRMSWTVISLDVASSFFRDVAAVVLGYKRGTCSFSPVVFLRLIDFSWTLVLCESTVFVLAFIFLVYRFSSSCFPIWFLWPFDFH